MKKQADYWRSIAVVIGIVWGVFAPGLVWADPAGDPHIFPPQSRPYGRTYSEWAAKWWQWALAIPVATHPLFDNGDCRVGQAGQVFFLGGRYCSTVDPNCNAQVVTRSCTVPSGKALLFPIVNVECSTLEGETLEVCGPSAIPDVPSSMLRPALSPAASHGSFFLRNVDEDALSHGGASPIHGCVTTSDVS
jgi:hypothetical protein